MLEYLEKYGRICMALEDYARAAVTYRHCWAFRFLGPERQPEREMRVLSRVARAFYLREDYHLSRHYLEKCVEIGREANRSDLCEIEILQLAQLC
eukprot:7886829-Prorocentrum_lima.AAC.1